MPKTGTPRPRRAPASQERIGAHRPQRPPEDGRGPPALNPAESPLAWLRHRRGPSGAPLISDVQFLAGERLRRDFESAMMGRRITTNWEAMGGGGRGTAQAAPGDAALAARQRYHQAIDAAGPELSRILVQVCCMAAGLEAAERALDLPQRSGKAVLGLALTALVRHYGIGADETSSRRTGRWGAAGYRPAIPGSGEP